MITQRKKGVSTPIALEAILEQVRRAVEENPRGITGTAWMRHQDKEETQLVQGMLIVAFRLLRQYRSSKAEAKEMAPQLFALLKKIRDDDLYRVFYRGMSSVLRHRGVRLPRKRFIIVSSQSDEKLWHSPL